MSTFLNPWKVEFRLIRLSIADNVAVSGKMPYSASSPSPCQPGWTAAGLAPSPPPSPSSPFPPPPTPDGWTGSAAFEGARLLSSSSLSSASPLTYHIPFCFPQHGIYSLHHPRWMGKQKLIHHQLLPAPSSSISKAPHQLVELRVDSLYILLVDGSQCPPPFQKVSDFPIKQQVRFEFFECFNSHPGTGVL